MQPLWAKTSHKIYFEISQYLSALILDSASYYVLVFNEEKQVPAKAKPTTTEASVLESHNSCGSETALTILESSDVCCKQPNAAAFTSVTPQRWSQIRSVQNPLPRHRRLAASAEKLQLRSGKKNKNRFPNVELHPELHLRNAEL